MKLQPLLIALALVTGASFASAATTADAGPAKVHKKKVVHKKRAEHHAMNRHDTRAMGAGPSHPVTDLNASAREHRMNQAYDDWLGSVSRWCASKQVDYFRADVSIPFDELILRVFRKGGFLR